MTRFTNRAGRRGTILPFITISLVALCGFMALSIDLGLVMVAKTQCQNAADVGAAAGARSIDGSAQANLSAASTNAKATAQANVCLGSAFQSSDVTLVQHGSYHYDPTAQTFSPQFPPVSPDNYNLTQVTMKRSNPTAFARIFSLSSMNVSATATATHRPRDVTIVLDYSGSMNNESDLWNCESYLGSANNSPNNTDTVVPTFGHYSSGSANLICTSSDTRVGKCNITVPVLGVQAMVDDYYQNARGAGGTAAFVNVPYTKLYTPPSGDSYLITKGTSSTPPTYATTVQDVTGDSAAVITAKTDHIPLQGAGSWNSANGYSAASFKHFTQGPGYWGMTFFIWPPYPDDPAAIPSPPHDWRMRFFLNPGGSYPNFGGALYDNTNLWNTSGNWLDPSDSNGSNYVINYKAILSWISTYCVQSSPSDNKPFPPTLRAGGILYYNSIPTDVPSAAYAHSYLNYNITDPTVRFWKEYIDYVIGVWRDPMGNIQRPGNPACSYGPDFTWGTVKVSAPVTGYAKGPSTRIHPQDNPQRPRHRFWFGPLTMIQFMSDTGLLPGTAHDISMIAAKLGVAGALTDIQNNHPNDMVSMILFNRPHYSGEPSAAGSFSQAQFSLSRNYTAMGNALWFSPTAGSSDVRPWDSNDIATPRAHGDYVSNTATSFGLMLAYNEFSSSATLRGQALGGSGRKGAQRLVILETDGMANQATSATFTNNGAINSYYNVRPGDAVTPSGSSAGTDAINVATKICALTTDMGNGPGFATPGKSVILHCIAFGAVFEPDAQGSEPANAMSFLQQLSTIGGTGFPSSVTASGDPYFYKLCTGTLQQRQDKMRTAFSKIMDSGNSIVLIR